MAITTSIKIKCLDQTFQSTSSEEARVFSFNLVSEYYYIERDVGEVTRRSLMQYVCLGTVPIRFGRYLMKIPI